MMVNQQQKKVYFLIQGAWTEWEDNLVIKMVH